MGKSAEAVSASPVYYGGQPDQGRFSGIPLIDMIPLPEKRGTVKGELLNTAGHELNHFLVAYSLGVQVKSLSVRPEGNSLGRTEFDGIISPDLFKIIAAAGSVAPVSGQEARGFGHDFMQIRLLDYVQNLSNSIPFARSRAQHILSGFDARVRQRCAEIIAYMGKVSGGMIPGIINRAIWELKNEKMGIWQNVSPQLETKPGRESTVVEHFGHIYILRHTIDGQTVGEETLICGLCGGKNVHSPNCPAAKYRKSLGLGLEIASFFDLGLASRLNFKNQQTPIQ